MLAATDDETSWLAIDPYPFVGPIEIELVPLLRNRWADASDAGDADRAFRRRVDMTSEIIGARAARARALAQVAAVVNLLALLPEEPDHFSCRPAPSSPVGDDQEQFSSRRPFG